MTEDERKFLSDTAKGRRCLEIGVYRCGGMRAMMLGGAVSYVGIDPDMRASRAFSNSTIVGDAMESSSFILGASPWGLHDYVVKGNAFDFAFIDGDHSFMPVLRDIITCAAIVSPGAIIAGHDFQMPSVKLAVKLIAESGLLGMLDTPVDTIWRFVVKAPVPIESSVDKDFVKVFRRLNTDSVGARINQLLDKYLEKMGSA